MLIYDKIVSYVTMRQFIPTYNIFRIRNMRKINPSIQISELFKALSQPARVEILLAIGSGEACVCHLEAKLKLRQAYISQHLMALRQAGILDARREGRFVYYRLANPQILEVLRQATFAAGVSAEQVLANTELPNSGCTCPKCELAATAVTLELSA
jgi:DNA-binding transcriptional ArsR family regulator